jgi:hypothetical protein
MKRIDNLVDNLAATVQELATELKEKTIYLRERHELLVAIRELEPNGPEPIEDLRERVQALKALKALEPRGSEPIEDLRERVQATATGTRWRNAMLADPPALPEPECETSRGSLGAALKRPSLSTYADAFSISDRHVRDLLPLFELATSDPLFDGELSTWFADDRCSWEDDLKPFPLLRRGPGRGRSSNLARNAARKAGKRTRYAENKQETAAAKDHERYLPNKKSREAA